MIFCSSVPIVPTFLFQLEPCNDAPINFQPQLLHDIVSFDIVFEALALMLDFYCLPLEHHSPL
jgi:hypothetical protein